MIRLPASTLSGYEQLRAQALGESCLAERGFAVLLRRGLLAWSLLWAATTPAVTRTPGGAAGPLRDTSLAPKPDPAIVQILAGMVLASRSEVTEHA